MLRKDFRQSFIKNSNICIRTFTLSNLHKVQHHSLLKLPHHFHKFCLTTLPFTGVNGLPFPVYYGTNSFLFMFLTPTLNKTQEGGRTGLVFNEQLTVTPTQGS